MQSNTITISENSQAEKLKSYYKFHSKIYDLTRWTFLFGRKNVLQYVPKEIDIQKILEVGCGTGHNLILLAKKYPHANIIGIDISEDMVNKAKKATAHLPNITILQTPYPTDQYKEFDLILFSYLLTLLNPGWDFWMTAAQPLLSTTGVVAVVDFHVSKFKWFRNHMANHNVRMEAHLLAPFQKNYQGIKEITKSAYFGIWEYFIFIGKKNQ
jgi:S-adenosylmethionine-diacylgycerolhomoserine-N-methlytransferase